MTLQPMTQAREVILDAAEVKALPGEAVISGRDDIRHAVLWRSGSSYAGLMTLDAGARLPTHTHRFQAHHVWVVEGDAQVLHHRLGPGSYWFIPPGTDHGLQAGVKGCSLFYLYVPPA